METDNNKKTILLLHGAIGSNQQLTTLKKSLSQHFEVHAPNLPGHGGEEMPEDFSIAAFAGFIKDYIDLHHLHQPIVFGYSMGGYIALYVNKHYPGLIGGIITLATKFHWDEVTAAKETSMLQPSVLEQKVPKFAEALAKLHSPQDWKIVLAHTATLMHKLGAGPLLKQEDYAAITTPCFLLVGDRDKMVSIEETLNVYRMIPAAQFSVLPATPHAVEQVPVQLLESVILGFTGK